MARGTSDGTWQSDAEIEREGLLNPAPTPIAFAPRPAPVPASVPAPRALQLRALSYEDVDRMWDWSRADASGAAKFLGVMPHTKALLDAFTHLAALQEQGTALVRAIDVSGTHIGFVVLNPIVRAPRPTGVVHCYLAPSVQGQLPQLMPELLAIAAEVEPTLMLTILTNDYAFAKLLQPFGFTLQIALTRPPNTTQG